MTNVFIAYSRKDIDKFSKILDNLNSMNIDCNLQYYQPTMQGNIEDILESLTKVKIFVVLISTNSLKSKYVLKEVSEAIRLSESGRIKIICPIIIDESIVNSDSRIPKCIKHNIFHATSQTKAAQLIQELVTRELSKV